jgi:hypothetical protein
MLPTAIEISGFRSFGQEPMLIGSLKKLNFFVGQNNSGKSNVLRAITLLSSLRGPDPLKPRSSDFAAGVQDICVYLRFPNRILKEIFSSRVRGSRDPRVEEIDESKSFSFPFTVDRNNAVFDYVLWGALASTSFSIGGDRRRIH